MLSHALVDSLISSAKKHDSVEFRIPPRSLLPEECSCGGQENNRGFRVRRGRLLGAPQTMAKQCFRRLKKRLGLQHHSLASAKWAIINAAVAILSENTQVLDVHFDEARLASAAQNPVVERTDKKLWENRDQVKAH